MNLKPDVILIEADSLSYYFKTGTFKPLPRWNSNLRRKGILSALGPEDEALEQYYSVNPAVVIKPYDVAFNGKERIKYRKETLFLETDFAVAMSNAFDKKEMTTYRENLHLIRRQYLTFLRQRISGTLQALNNDSTTKVIEKGETLEQEHFKSLVDSVSSLKPFAERVRQGLNDSKYRNEVMVQQIIRYIKEYSGKRIVVLTGALHRYYQLDALAPKQQELNFKLLDFNGKEMTFQPQSATWTKN